MALNKALIMGRLTADVELRYTQTNKTVTSFTVAVDRGGKDQGTDFINCVAWEKTAEMVQKYFCKGRMICVEGRIQVRSYEDQQRNKRIATEIVAERVYFTGERKEDGNQSYGYQSRPAGVPVEYGDMEMRELGDDDGELPF